MVTLTLMGPSVVVAAQPGAALASDDPTSPPCCAPTAAKAVPPRPDRPAPIASRSVTAVVGYDFRLFHHPASVILGYRAIAWDYTDGSGTSEFTGDVAQHGVMLGFGMRFQAQLLLRGATGSREQGAGSREMCSGLHDSKRARSSCASGLTCTARSRLCNRPPH
mgnify:CR=1 FL=1